MLRPERHQDRYALLRLYEPSAPDRDLEQTGSRAARP
jgi:hypothetical protein